MLDDALKEMLSGYVEHLQAWLATRRMALDDVCWDAPVAFNPPCDVAALLSVSHAIGMIAGIAAGLNVTPLELLWTIGTNTEAIDTTAAPVHPKLAEGAVSAKRRRSRQASPTRKVRP